MIDGFGKKPLMKLPFTSQLSKLRLKQRFEDLDYRIVLITKRKAADNGPMNRINNLKREG
jgi:hypothetical protein